MKKILLLLVLCLSFCFGYSQYGSVLTSLTPSPYVGMLQSGIYTGSADTVYVCADSYGASVGATIVANGWVQRLGVQMNCILVNNSFAGKTMMAQTPIDYQGPLSMTQTLSQIPTKTSNRRMLIIAFGLNDMGQTAAAYTLANFQAAYDTVMTNIISKGWLPSQILLIPPYCIPAAGYAQYATITGNAAPTAARHKAFVNAVKDESIKWGHTNYLDIYDDEAAYDTSAAMFSGSDHIHPLDSLYRFIYYDAARYLGISPYGKNIFIGTNNAVSVNNPSYIRMGGEFEALAHNPAFDKFQLYYDGTALNTCGLSIASGKFYFDAFGGGSYIFNVSNVAAVTLSLPASPLLQMGVKGTGVSTSTPTQVNEGNTFSSVPGDITQLKYYIYDNNTKVGKAGFTYSTDGFDIHSSGGIGHNFWIDSVRYLNVQPTYLTVNSAMLKTHGLSTDSVFGYRHSASGQDTTVGFSVADLASGGFSNPMTTTGDMIYSSSGSTAARVGVGATNQVMTVSGGIPAWGPVVTSASYTPTLTNTTNITTNTLQQAYYIRVGNIVHVTVSGSMTPTTANSISILTITLPFTASTTTSSSIGMGMVYGASALSDWPGGCQIGSSTTATFSFDPLIGGNSSSFSVSFDFSL